MVAGTNTRLIRGDLIVGAVSGAWVPLEAINVSCGLNVTGELGAYYIGAWTLQRGGAGSFRGVTLQSQGAPHNQFLSTLDVQGGRGSLSTAKYVELLIPWWPSGSTVVLWRADAGSEAGLMETSTETP